MMQPVLDQGCSCIACMLDVSGNELPRNVQLEHPGWLITQAGNARPSCLVWVDDPSWTPQEARGPQCI